MVDAVTATRYPRREHYDLSDIAEMVTELHSCVHKVGEDLSEHRTEVAKGFGAIGERVAKLEGKSEAIGQRVGVVDAAQVQKPAWFPKPWQVIGGMCAGVGGFVTIWKIAAVVLPALNHAILAQH